MAPRGQKRTASAPAEEPGAKRVAEFLKQHGVTQASYAPAPEIVQHPLAGLTDEVRKMILAAMPWSLAIPADARHPAQEAVVRMVAETAETIQAALQHAAAIETGKVDELTAGKAAVEAKVQHMEAALDAACTCVEGCTQQLEEAKSASASSTEALQAAEAESALVGSQLGTAVTSKSELEKVLADSFHGLRDGTLEESAVEASVQMVMAAVEKLGLEGSLVATLPAVLSKRERGAFDVVVIQGAEQGICEKIAAFGAEAEALTASSSEKAAVVEAATASVKEAAAHEADAVGKLEAANAASSEAAATLEATRVELTRLEADVVQAAAVQEAKQQEFDQFCNYNMSIFQMLRERTANKDAQEKLEESREESAQECSEDAQEIVPDVAVDKVADKVESVLAEDQRATLVAVAGA